MDLTPLSDPGQRDVQRADPGLDTTDTPDVLPDLPFDESPTDAEPDILATPRITVLPDTVDFGFAAQGIAVQRTVNVRNGGTAPLSVSAVTLPDDSAGEFTADAGAVLAGPIAPGVTIGILVSATNGGLDSAAMNGVLRIASDDPTTPTFDVVLTARRAAAPTCSLELVPAELNFGTVAKGFTRELPMNLVNTGDSPLQVDTLTVNHCETLDGTVTCGSFLGGSPWWSIALAPDAASVVAPGSHTSIRVRVNVPAAGSTLLPDLPGRYAIAWRCPAGAPASQPYTFPTDCAPSAPCPPNLGVVVGVPAVTATPSEVLFADALQGCESPTTRVRLKNTGDVTVRMTSVALDPACPDLAAFTLAAPSPLPTDIVPGAWLDAFVGFVPTSSGPSNCALLVTLGSPTSATLRVPLAGTSSSDGSRTDRFVQVAHKSDLLLVLDTTGSMLDTLPRFVDALPALVKAAKKAGTDTRFGIIGIGMDPACATTANLQGTPRLLDPADLDSVATTVAAMFDDSSCDASMREAGLEAVRLALSPPRIDDEGQSCALDNVCAEGHRCVDGACGGANRGFLRPDAALDVVIVSDEDDQSPEPVAAYATFLDGLKGGGGAGLVRLHAIAGDLPNGCDTTLDYAAPGTRYSQIVEATGGTFTGICQPSLDAALTALGDLPYVPRIQFPLSGRPWQESLAVTVDDVACTQGWIWSAAPSAIVFDPAGPCFPGPGAQVVVRYFEPCP